AMVDGVERPREKLSRELLVHSEFWRADPASLNATPPWRPFDRSVTVVALERPEDGGLLLRVLPNVVARQRVVSGESEPGSLSASLSFGVEEDWELPAEPACDAFVSRLKASPHQTVCGGHCVICAEDIVEYGTPVVTLNCQHVFHEDCIRRWLTRRHTCPTCRLELEVDDVRYLRSIGLKEEADALEKVKQERMAQEQQQQAAERRRWVESMRRGEPVHFGLVCGSCSVSPVVGDCYRCKDCEDFVLCRLARLSFVQLKNHPNKNKFRHYQHTMEEKVASRIQEAWCSAGRGGECYKSREDGQSRNTFVPLSQLGFCL
ncbi:RDUF1, partial [Symbiodinium pilosum]